MIWMKPGGCAVVLDAQPEITTFCIGEADNSLDKITVRQTLAITFEFDSEGFTQCQWRRQMHAHLQATCVG